MANPSLEAILELGSGVWTQIILLQVRASGYNWTPFGRLTGLSPTIWSFLEFVMRSSQILSGVIRFFSSRSHGRSLQALV